MQRGFPILFVLLGACAAPSAQKPAFPSPKTHVARGRVVAPARLSTIVVELARKDGLAAEVKVDGTALEVATRGVGALAGCRWLIASAASLVDEEREAAAATLRAETTSAIARLVEIEGALGASGSSEAPQTWDTAHALAEKRLASKGMSRPIATAHARALERVEALKSEGYGPHHTVVEQAVAEATTLELQKAREEQVEVGAAKQELAALDAMPKANRTPAAVEKLRRTLLAERLAEPGVTAERGVDADAPSDLRALAHEHLSLRVERARDAVVYGDAHPKMIASKARLAQIEKDFAGALVTAIAHLSSGAAMPEVKVEELRRERRTTIERLAALEAKRAALPPRAVVEKPCSVSAE